VAVVATHELDEDLKLQVFEVGWVRDHTDPSIKRLFRSFALGISSQFASLL